MFDTIALMDEVLPKDQPRYLMGVGRPTDLVKAMRHGVDMFDCVMPTRNARNVQLFSWEGPVNIKNSTYAIDHSVIDESSNSKGSEESNSSIITSSVLSGYSDSSLTVSNESSDS